MGGKKAGRSSSSVPLFSDPREAVVGGIFNLRLFDGPAHLLPPLSTLFNPMMEGVLRKPDKVGADAKDGVEGAGAEEEEDTAMEGVVVHSPDAERVVNESEMDTFTDLFAQMFGGSSDLLISESGTVFLTRHFDILIIYRISCRSPKTAKREDHARW